MKLNKKGFVSSAVLYSLLLLFLALILGLLSLLSNRKQILDKLKGDIKNEINQINIYDVYENGTAVYYNPVTGKMCGDYKEENSLNENKTGCMKWYIFNDNKNRATVDMILDHNTTATVEWNSEETNVEMKEVKTELNKLVSESNWKQEARLITADEVAQITGAKDALSWSSDKTYADTPDGKTNISYFYLDGKDGKDITWHTKVATTQDASNYAWLYNYTKDCTSFGCNTADSSNFGYWTSTPVFGIPKFAWKVNSDGKLSVSNVGINGSYGVRPVITISKKNMENVQIETVYDYTGKEQQFIVPKTGNYKIETWGAQGDVVSNIGYGGYSKGDIKLDKSSILYIVVGQQGQYIGIGGYNGGGNGSGNNSAEYGYSTGGGGATHIATKSGLLSTLENYKTNILIVSGGGGGHSGWENNGTGGSGGGYIGNESTGESKDNISKGGTQISGGIGHVYKAGTFGLGGSILNTNYSAGGGGGGFYGGGCAANGGGGGGSGYIGNTLLTNKVMYCYNCTESTDENTKTVSTTNVSEEPISEYAKKGNGYAKITYLSD